MKYSEAFTPRSVVESRAEKIANFIIRTNSDARGDLIGLVARKLRNNGQNYTASLLEEAEAKYQTGK